MTAPLPPEMHCNPAQLLTRGTDSDSACVHCLKRNGASFWLPLPPPPLLLLPIFCFVLVLIFNFLFSVAIFSVSSLAIAEMGLMRSIGLHRLPIVDVTIIHDWKGRVRER